MDILLCTDNNYVMPTGVLMTSISINNKYNIKYHIFVDDSFTDGNKSSLIDVAKKFSHKIDFYKISRDILDKFPVGEKNQPKHITVASYYRLLITEILPLDVHKILYLDGDMIVRDSLEYLWNIDINEKAIGAVHDYDENIHVNSKRLPYPMENGYFNAGMLLINVDFWRKHDLYHTFMEFIEKNKGLLQLHDQDVLNATLWDKTLWLPFKYNFQHQFVFVSKIRNIPEKYINEIENSKFNPTIIHFCCIDKPWNINYYQTYVPVWRYYWRRTKWFKDKLTGEHTKRLRTKIKFWLLRYGLYMPPMYYERIFIKK